MYMYGSGYLILIICAVISGLAALNVKSTYRRYSKAGNARGITGAEAAQEILRGAGITDVSIRRVSGELTDYYSPKEKVLCLSDAVYGSTSVAAVGVAAHECGHAIQDAQSYMPLKFRSLYVPVANFGSKISWPVLLLGVFFGLPQLAEAGVWLFALVVFLELVTLPVEFNASHRALKILDTTGMLGQEELSGSRKVLIAAALTYVAALFTGILQLLRMVAIARGGSSSRRRR